MIQIAEIQEQARGRWDGIFSKLGVYVPEKGKPSPCPMCGGRDRFTYQDKDGSGSYFCRQCEYHAGDGISLARKITGKPLSELLKEIADIVGLVEQDIPKKKQTKDPRIALKKVWDESVSLYPAVTNYLKSRGIEIMPDNIRYNHSCWESDTRKNYPAMIARVQNAEGKPICLHRTYLSGYEKANIPSTKKLMPATESLKGSAIRIAEPKKTMGVAEGIETALSCIQMFSMPVWATISTAIMESWIPPEGVKHIIIFADNDLNYAGGKSAYKLANTLHSKGFDVEVKMPETKGYDFNDVLRKTKTGRQT